ncbi:hypothetical protein [Enterovibrio nigricans]|uniref:Butirosin biosynthesis protein H, N-terminal n=1 Tax=Enterovibrio nigricans DSM 22720 TaxID=1121868 RepID=A0A1T4VLI4_9GAMM|nr:hypothetical protein [Enterovibrio nigricans]PKF49625.1 hypothetical protein AT251_17525 [Enterovibrio nigricans]SKA65789.1 Butirosin biosynthesis protein H, N-terminal [Enterovibrio nigricans DSM 22720]
MTNPQCLIQSLPVSTFEFDKESLEAPPNCFVFGLYTLASMEHAILPISALFAEHSFSFWDDYHTHEQIIDPLTEYTKFAFFRHHKDPYLAVTTEGVYGEMVDMMSDRCGISIDVLPFTHIDDFLNHVHRQFELNRPILLDFDMGYIPSRHQYKIIVGNEHTVFLTQYRQDTQQFLINDQDIVNDPVPLDDFIACFDSMIKMKGTFNCYQVTLDKNKPSLLTVEQIKEDVQKNVANLSTDHFDLGMQAVKRYIHAMIELKSLNENFSTFGTWVFINQRKLQTRWCDLVAQTLTSPEQVLALAQLRNHLTVTLSKWSEYAMLEKLVRKTERIRPEQQVKKGIEAAQLELESPTFWLNLQKTL